MQVGVAVAKYVNSVSKPEACSVGKRPASLACILASTQQARLRNGVLKQMADSDVVMSELLTASPSMASVLEPLVNFSCTQSELILTVTS